jgi:dihydroxy-acid dehydratase
MSGQVLQICSENRDTSDIPWKWLYLVRRVLFVFKAYALLATRADEGAVLDASKMEN